MYEIRTSTIKGNGVFATQDIKKNEFIFQFDLNPLPRYSLEEIDTNPKLKVNADHSDYFGHGKYVIDLSPPSYLNHSCSPNCYIKMKTIAIKDVYTLRNIEKGEELTVDYTLTAVDQFAGMGFWELDCKCGSENCRGKLIGDFFTLPKETQLKFYHKLPPSIIRKYRERFKKLKE
jgi:SET domain-containing protein